MSKKTSLNWRSPGKTVDQFLKSNAFVRGLRGPVGSGKSVACCIEIIRKGMAQKPDKSGRRRTRWAIVRNTIPELKTTTVKTWREWIDDRWGKFNWQPPFIHNVLFKHPDKKTSVEIEVIFLALDKEADVKKLLSLELTGIWINEAREIPKSVVDACTMRVGRFPARKDGGPTWYGVIMDTNSPSEDHWWGIVAGEVPMPDYLTEQDRISLNKPDDWEFFRQPPGMLEQLDEQGNIVGYELNPERENADNVVETYYQKIVAGKTSAWVKVYVLNQYQTLIDGKPIYPSFRRDAHVAKAPLEAMPGVPLICGIDFGRTPACVVVQQSPDGRWLVLHEILAQDMGAKRFASVIQRELAKHGWDGWPDGIAFWGDPAGTAKTQADDRSPFDMLRVAGITARPAPTNDPDVRIEAVEQALNRMVDGKPGLLVSPVCITLINGFESGYHYRKMQVPGEQKFEERPNKNRFSHPHDALQYGLVGGGEGRRVTHGNTPRKAVTVNRSFNPFARLRTRRSTTLARW